MSATHMRRQTTQPGGALWRDRARLEELARAHALPAGAAILAGAILRLLWLGDTSFLGDQAQLLALGRSAADHRALIITGIPSSIKTLNPPVSSWIYGAFALIGGPLGATLFTALVNVAAIALLYAIAARYLSRRAGFAAALLYATASGPVHYSRFIWQQNLLAPVVLLYFWVILLAVVERRRGWLGWSVLLWGIAVQLHPTAAPLLGLIAVALAFTWRDLRRRDVAWAAVAFAALFSPTLVWELVSHGSDLMIARRFTQGHAIFDTWAFTYLVQLMQPAPASWFGAASSYTATGRALAALGWLIEALLIAAQVWLVGELVGPLARRSEQRAAMRAALANARWRFVLLLALWEALPIALMLRHTRPVEPHYLLVLLPGAYLCIGGFLAWASQRLQAALAARAPHSAQQGALVTFALSLLIVALGAAQTIGVSRELATIHSGTFDGLALPLHYGTPLSSEVRALNATQAAARQAHAAVAIAATRVQQEPLGYLNATASTGAAATDYISDGCVALPASSAQASLITLALPDTTAAQLLPHIQGARSLGPVAVQGGSPYLLYNITPGASVTGERAVAAPATGGQPQAIAYAYTTAPGATVALTIRWTGAPTISPTAAGAVSYWYGADPRGTPIADYTFTLQALDAQGQAIGAPLATTCARLGWSRSFNVVTSTTVPAALQAGGRIAAWRVITQMQVATVIRPTLGPLTLETGAITYQAPEPLGNPTTFAAPLS